MSEPALTKCPKCGKKKLRRLFGTGAAVLFKGSGFYETDYRSESYKKAAKADQEGGKSDKKEAGGTNGKADPPAAPAAGKGKKSEKKTSKSGD